MKIIVEIRKPRNYLVTLARSRKASFHEKNPKSSRQQDKAKLKKANFPD
jgi:hypothetical protein